MMKKTILAALMCGTVLGAFAQAALPDPEFTPLAVLAAATDTAPIPGNIRNNQYYLKSLELTKLAQNAYNNGDYDKSTEYAAEALKYAQQSDEYVALQLKIKAANDAITTARSRFDWATAEGAAQRFPSEYGRAQTAFNEALSFRAAQSWDPAIDAAHQVIEALANVTAAPKGNGGDVLPAQYTVRTWQRELDCLWNIAEKPWAYGDSSQWRLLYEANRSKLSDSSNPNLIEPGLVLDIPSLKGEQRRGSWDPDKTYNPLR